MFLSHDQSMLAGGCRVVENLFRAKIRIFKFYCHENDISDQKNISADKNNLANLAKIVN